MDQVLDEHVCNRCDESFSSKNKLFLHLRNRCWKTTSVPTPDKQQRSPSPLSKDAVEAAYVRLTTQTVIVKSTATKDNKPPGFAFRGLRYVTMSAKLGKADAQQVSVCGDTGTLITLADRTFIINNIPDVVVRKMPSPLPVRGVGSTPVTANEFADIKVYMDGIIKGKRTTAEITIEVYLVDELKANILIGTDVLVPEKITFNLETYIMRIGSCQGIEVPISTKVRRTPHIHRSILAKSPIVVPSGATMEVPVLYKGALPEDRDFIFEPSFHKGLGNEGGIFAHVVDATLSFVQVKNSSPLPIKIGKKHNLGQVVECSYDGAYIAHPDMTRFAPSGWKKPTLPAYTTTTAKEEHPKAPTIDPSMEHAMPNRIIIYGKPDVATQLATVVDEFPEIWTDRGTTVDIPEDQWMPIPLLLDAKSQPAKVYPVSQKDRQVIDETFDKLYRQGKMTWSIQPTLFSYPCFVVWRQIPNGERKGRVVIDIRGLNKITVKDSYPLPLQSEVIAKVAGYAYITIVDARGWFHQFMVRYEDRHKLTVVSHRGQEQSNIALMGYQDSPPYIQRQTDRLLYEMRGFVKAYVDDIIIFSSTLDDYINHLRQFFTLC